MLGINKKGALIKMGLAVSQVRLLALTSRKADIELQMQINSKRKMMLTRKSTELAQQYYNKLQNSNIMYATSNGYEDVNYNYIMGSSRSGVYTSEFVKDLLFNNDDNIPKKFESNMILTDQYGRVIANDEISKIATSADKSYQGERVITKTAQAICEFISTHRSDEAYSKIFAYMEDGTQLNNIDNTKRDMLAHYLELMITNGGYKNGGHIYIGSGNVGESGAHYYSTPEAAAAGDKSKEVKLEAGVNYSVFDSAGKSVGDQYYGAFWDGSRFVPINSTAEEVGIGSGVWQSIGNLVTYLAPIISAAIQNGVSSKVEEGKPNYELNSRPAVATFTPKGSPSSVTATEGTHAYYYDSTADRYQYFVYDGSEWVEYIDVGKLSSTKYNADQAINPGDSTTEIGAKKGALAIGEWTFIKNSNGSNSDYGYYKDSSGTTHKFRMCTSGSSVTYYSDIDYTVTENDIYQRACNVDNLQAGFKAGTFQLAMVGDVERGAYHKNTTMTYFTHMNYVSDKIDNSKREEITAWFNAEQAAINEKETYWDTEIQNLSTELTAVNTEIDSVKNLKSDGIKKVFDWGGS